jgi:hypothetical protein
MTHSFQVIARFYSNNFLFVIAAAESRKNMTFCGVLDARVAVMMQEERMTYLFVKLYYGR